MSKVERTLGRSPSQKELSAKYKDQIKVSQVDEERSKIKCAQFNPRGQLSVQQDSMQTISDRYDYITERQPTKELDEITTQYKPSAHSQVINKDKELTPKKVQIEKQPVKTSFKNIFNYITPGRIILLIALIIGSIVLIKILINPKQIISAYEIIGQNGSKVSITQKPLVIDGKQTLIIAKGDIIQNIDIETKSTLRDYLVTSSIESGKQYEFEFTFMEFFNLFTNPLVQTQLFKDWLRNYNLNPRAFIDKFLSIMKNFQYTSISNSIDKIKLNQLIEQTWVDIIYNINERKLEVMRYEDSVKDNLKTENKAQNSNKITETESNQYQNDQQRTTQQQAANQQRLLRKVMQSTIQYMKQTISRGITTLQAERQQLIKSYKQTFGETIITEEWQKALIQCRTIETYRFRCSLEAARKLIEGLTQEKLKAPNSNYVFTHGLSIIFKQIISQ